MSAVSRGRFVSAGPVHRRHLAYQTPGRGLAAHLVRLRPGRRPPAAEVAHGPAGRSLCRPARGIIRARAGRRSCCTSRAGGGKRRPEKSPPAARHGQGSGVFIVNLDGFLPVAGAIHTARGAEAKAVRVVTPATMDIRQPDGIGGRFCVKPLGV